MHQIHYDTFSIKTSKEKISKTLNDRAIHNSDNHHGLYHGIRFIDKCFNGEDAARQYIVAVDNGWYDQLAVRYRHQKDFKPSKTLLALQEKAREASTAYHTLSRAFHFADHKSASVGCKHCGSKISLSFLHSNYCPVCRHDMRPESTLKRIKTLEANYTKLERDAEQREFAERAKTLDKAEEFWLVKTEYHV